MAKGPGTRGSPASQGTKLLWAVSCYDRNATTNLRLCQCMSIQSALDALHIQCKHSRRSWGQRSHGYRHTASQPYFSSFHQAEIEIKQIMQVSNSLRSSQMLLPDKSHLSSGIGSAYPQTSYIWLSGWTSLAFYTLIVPLSTEVYSLYIPNYPCRCNLHEWVVFMLSDTYRYILPIHVQYMQLCTRKHHGNCLFKAHSSPRVGTIN